MTAEIRELEKKLEAAKLKESIDTLRAGIPYISQAEHIDWHHSYQERANIASRIYGILTYTMRQGLSLGVACPICSKEMSGELDEETEVTFEELVQQVKDSNAGHSPNADFGKLAMGYWQADGERLLEDLEDAVLESAQGMDMGELEDHFGIQIEIDFSG